MKSSTSKPSTARPAIQAPSSGPGPHIPTTFRKRNFRSRTTSPGRVRKARLFGCTHQEGTSPLTLSTATKTKRLPLSAPSSHRQHGGTTPRLRRALRAAARARRFAPRPGARLRGMDGDVASTCAFSNAASLRRSATPLVLCALPAPGPPAAPTRPSPCRPSTARAPHISAGPHCAEVEPPRGPAFPPPISNHADAELELRHDLPSATEPSSPTPKASPKMPPSPPKATRSTTSEHGTTPTTDLHRQRPPRDRRSRHPF